MTRQKTRLSTGEVTLSVDEWRARALRAEACIADIIEANERYPRDSEYERRVREIGAHSCGAIMAAARHVWGDLLAADYGIKEGAHCIAPALPVLRAAIGRKLRA